MLFSALVLEMMLVLERMLILDNDAGGDRKGRKRRMFSTLMKREKRRDGELAVADAGCGEK